MATQYYYDVSTGRVQEVEHKGQAKDLMGPYATREEAADALRAARLRTEENDRRDREEDDW
ncbi:hypothetical protein GTQ99_17460 [Kineococcus sp. T13]|uniref:hypothetical protein n=1 Tax=Kineococcus vitellinus TaxID=2696565 RepID=UPI0014127F8F|nr:hypothetical protein [Kineococcus vitellinus]NAZ77196.1 hypothetical protein [Kineococcus vitellinus]